MNISDHYKNAINSKSIEYKQKTLNIIKIIMTERPQFDFAEILEKTLIDKILMESKQLEDLPDNKKSEILNKKEKLDQETVSLEPKTWDDVLKLINKKLLITEFISMNIKNKESRNQLHLLFQHLAAELVVLHLPNTLCNRCIPVDCGSP